MEFKEIQLTHFAELLSNATAAAKMAQSPALRQAGPWNDLPDVQAWSERARELSVEMAARHGAKIAITAYRAPVGSMPTFKDHPSMAPAKSLGALRLAVEALPEQALDVAAKEVAKHLATPFDRGGASYLALQQEGAGLKVRETKSGPELSHWNSRWSQTTQSNVSALARSWRNPIAASEEAAPALEALRQYWEGVHDIHRLVEGGVGDSPDLGVHAGDKLPGSSKSDEEMPWATPVEQAANHAALDRAIFEVAESDPAGRRLGWLAIAMLLGDRPSASQAASGHAAPAMMARKSVALEGARNAGEAHKKIAFNGQDRSKRPAICAMQTAMELAVFFHYIKAWHAHAGGGGDNSVHSLVQAGHSFGYAFATQDELEGAGESAKEAAETIRAIHKASCAIMEKAYGFARDIQNEWLERHGFGQALIDARLIEGVDNPSVKAVNWALGHPEAARAAREAKGDPLVAFATASSRYLGLDAGPETIVEAARLGWSAKGLSGEAFDDAAGHEGIRTGLMKLAAEEMGAARKDKAVHKERVELMCAQLTAARAEGASPEEAFAFANWCAGEAMGFFTPSYGGELRQGIPKRSAGGVEQSLRALQEANDKAAGWPWALRAAFRAQARGEGLGETPPKEWNSEAAKLLNMACGTPQSLARMDWSIMGPSTRWIDLARGAGGALAQALRQAEESGPHGEFAARVAGSLGIDDAVDGNDLIGKTREALKTQWGVSAGAWKALGQLDASARDRLAAALEKRHRAALEQKGRWLIEERQAMEEAAKDLGLGLDMLDWSARIGLPLRHVGAIDKLSRQQRQEGGLLSPSARPIEVNSVESARLALTEARAKQERLPRIVKTLAERLESFEKAAAKAADPNPEQSARAKIKEELDQVDDWLRACEEGVWQTLPAKASFSDVMRRQKEWHEDMATRQAVGTSKAKWDSPLDKFEREGWEAHLLGNASSLTEEGRAMRHCVSSYASQCKAGKSRIFSVKLNGERVCTLELGLRGPSGAGKDYKHHAASSEDRWEIVQNKGSCNQAVDGAAAEFCKKVASQMNEAHAKWVVESEKKRSLAAQKAAQTRRKVVLEEALVEEAAPAEQGLPTPAKKKLSAL